MEKLRVIQLVEDLKIGGAERVIADIAEGVDRNLFDASVWCVSRGGETAEELRKKGIEVRVLGIKSYHNPLNIFRLSSQLKKAIPDIVHTHGYFASVIGRLAARRARISVIISHVHSTYWEYKKKHILMEKALSRITDRIICCSKAVENFVRGYEKIKPEKTLMIYNGVDEDRFSTVPDTSSLRAQLAIEEGASVVGTISSLTPHKGHAYLIQAAVKVHDSWPAAKFLIVGDGLLRKTLEEQAGRLNIASSVIFAGIQKNIPEVLSLMDVFVLPSYSREGLGIAIIEAMAAGKPVVATNIGGIPEVVKDGETGYLAPPQNPEALAQAIIKLLQNPTNAKAMGKQGRIRFEKKFTKKRMLSEVENLYAALIDKKKENQDEKI